MKYDPSKHYIVTRHALRGSEILSSEQVTKDRLTLDACSVIRKQPASAHTLQSRDVHVDQDAGLIKATELPFSGEVIAVTLSQNGRSVNPYPAGLKVRNPMGISLNNSGKSYVCRAYFLPWL